MRKAVLPLAMACLFIWAGQAMGAIGMGNYIYNPQDLAKATGTVMATGLNSIDIYDEEEKCVESFVYLGKEQYHKCDYIRIFYHPRGAIVAKIIRMTVLEYRNGQNLGNIFHRP